MGLGAVLTSSSPRVAREPGEGGRVRKKIARVDSPPIMRMRYNRRMGPFPERPRRRVSRCGTVVGGAAIVVDLSSTTTMSASVRSTTSSLGLLPSSPLAIAHFLGQHGRTHRAITTTPSSAPPPGSVSSPARHPRRRYLTTRRYGIIPPMVLSAADGMGGGTITIMLRTHIAIFYCDSLLRQCSFPSANGSCWPRV